MAKTFRLPKEEPLLDIVSYCRSALHENGGRLKPDQVAQIRRTVNRVPEVIVKVLPRASNDLNAAAKHLDYISRHGKLPLEMDDGDELVGRRGNAVLEEWDLDIDDLRRQASLAAANGRKPPKLVHKLMFSMPAGTPRDKVLAAVRNFAREQFWGQHRYAFVLHTDEPHPHVHFMLKAVSEQGIRLNIKKGTLRRWRSEFARHLRLLGVAANATERAVRGETRTTKKDGIYRASLRGDSTYMRAQAEAVSTEIHNGHFQPEPAKQALLLTRAEVMQGWMGVVGLLTAYGDRKLAGDVIDFSSSMSRPQTDRERIASELRVNAQARQREAKVPS